jgi:hypothetical protein
LALGAVLAAAAVGVSALLAGALDGTAAPRPAIGEHAVPRAMLPHVAAVSGYAAAQRAAFPAFARPQTKVDVIPSRVVRGTSMLAQFTGMNPRLGRRILADAIGTLYLLPGRGRVCMIAVSAAGLPTGAECAAMFRAAATGFFQLQPAPGTVTVTGVAPSRMIAVTFLTSGRSKVTVRISRGGGYRALLPDMPIGVTYTTARDRSVKIGIGFTGRTSSKRSR